MGIIVRYWTVLSKILPLFVIVSLLSLPVANILRASVPALYENASVEAFLTADDDWPSEDYFLKAETKIPISVDLIPDEILSLRADSLRSMAKPVMAVLSLKEIISEIFIPPQSVFQG